MPVMSTRIDDKTKREVDAFPDVNWSEVMRRAILARLEEEKRRRRRKDMARIRKAVEGIDALRRRCAGDTTAELRRWRRVR